MTSRPARRLGSVALDSRTSTFLQTASWLHSIMRATACSSRRRVCVCAICPTRPRHDDSAEGPAAATAGRAAGLCCRRELKPPPRNRLLVLPQNPATVRLSFLEFTDRSTLWHAATPARHSSVWLCKRWSRRLRKPSMFRIRVRALSSACSTELHGRPRRALSLPFKFGRAARLGSASARYPVGYQGRRSR
jgi:hypothetical protein